jgi:Ca2+-binding RTX toxin-like protein
MADFSFSALTNGQHVAFNTRTDRLLFAADVDAGAVELTQTTSGLSITVNGKSVQLDGLTAAQLTQRGFVFANGGRLIVGDGTGDPLADWYGQDVDLSTSAQSDQVRGLGGADFVRTGGGADWLVGNDALTPLQHVSRAGSTGAPTAAFDPSISADGRFVAFSGGWTGFGSSGNNSTDVLVKDLRTGLVSNEHASAAGALGGSGSAEPRISADGGSLVFESASSNLVTPDDGSLLSIYLSAVAGTGISRVSRGTGGTLATDGSAENPDLSGTGRYVVFESSTSNWASGGNVSGMDIYIRDTTTGTLTRVSTSLTAGDGNADSLNAHISNDGRFVVFQSGATNLTAGDTNGQIDVFVWDRTTGELHNLTTAMVGARLPNSSTLNPDVAFDANWGGVITFETAKGLVAADTNNFTDVYAYNMFDETFQLVSSRTDGTGVGVSSGDASVSGDGRFVTFTSGSSQLVAGDTNSFDDVFVKDLFTGAIALVSRTPAGAGGNQHSRNPEISLGGEWIVFESGATNLAATDGNGGLNDVFRVSNPLLRDTLDGGAGNDTYVLAREDVVVEALNGGTDTVRSSINYTLGTNLENLVLTGAANLTGTGNTATNQITGNSGHNSLSGLAGNDVLSGERGQDDVNGGTGSDVIVIHSSVGTASDSARVAVTGTNNDRGEDVVRSFSLTQDTLRIAATNVSRFVHGTDTTTGAAGAEVAGGRTAFSALTGLIELNQATDNNWTDRGDIAITFATPSSTLTESAFEARLQYQLTGTTAANTLAGGGLADVLAGSGGNDALRGGGGNDTLVGGAGADTMLGGSGNDVFDFNGLSDLGLGATGDVLSGWNTGDVIDLRTIDAGAASGDQAFVFRGTSAFTAAGQVRYANGVLQFNTDADASVEFNIVITGTPPASLVAGSSLLL